MKTFYITTPIYYVNDKPHIGHAYTTIAADVLARWKRMQGEQVFFLTGTDEHGSKIAQAAEKARCAPQEYVDRLAEEFKSLWKALNISNDDFIRTTEKRHQELVQAVFDELLRKQKIYKGHYEDWYCVSCESFLLENELVEKKCPQCGRPVEKLKEESYFFKLSEYQGRLLELYADDRRSPKFLSDQYASEIRNFVKSGLKDISVSRLKEKWGIPVLQDPGHTVYVWFDALLNYLTAANYTSNSQPSTSFSELWPCDIHFVGKEIFRFHAVTWPAMLMALGLEPPRRVFAHGWWTVGGEKMSKSQGNVVDPMEIVREYNVDSFRYFILREMPFGLDGDFSRDAFKKRYNAELANDLGNLFSRTLTLIEKNLSGQIKKGPEKISFSLSRYTETSGEKSIEQAYQRVAFQDVLNLLMEVVKQANIFIEQNAPWKLAKEDPEKCEKVLTECFAVLVWLSAGFYPFMPETCEKMWKQLGQKSELKHAAWRAFKDPLNPQFYSMEKINREGILFPRKHDEK